MFGSFLGIETVTLNVINDLKVHVVLQHPVSVFVPIPDLQAQENRIYFENFNSLTLFTCPSYIAVFQSLFCYTGYITKPISILGCHLVQVVGLF